MPRDRSVVETTTSTAAVAPLLGELLPPVALAVERITVPLGGGLLLSTSAAKVAVTLWPPATDTG